MNLLDRLGLSRLVDERNDIVRVVLLLFVCLACGLMVVDYARVPTETLEVAAVAPRTVKAPFSFKYQDFAERERRQNKAVTEVPLVFDWYADLGDRLRARTSAAFVTMRERAARRDAQDQDPSVEPLTDAEAVAQAEAFRTELGVHINVEKLLPVVTDGFPQEAEELATQLLDRSMGGYVIRSREVLPSDDRVIRVLEHRGVAEQERVLGDFDHVRTPEEAQEQITFGRIESGFAQEEWADSSAAIARAMVNPNFVFNPKETKARRDKAVAAVPMTPITVKRGTTLFRQGDVLNLTQVAQYRALQGSAGENTYAMKVTAVTLFLVLLFAALYQFGASYLPDFSTRLRDAVAVGVLLALTALFARIAYSSADSIVGLIGGQASPYSVWFLVPVAGASMLVRLLVGVSWTIVFSAAAAILCSLVMDLQGLYIMFFLLSGVWAAGAVEHTRERMSIIRAGVSTGAVNALAVLLIHFLQMYIADSEISLTTQFRPFWSMGFGFMGGLLSAGLVLALVPLFESAGFVTDYRLMELANLQHPLLRQLMLRAPGSYHHSVVVGSLAEAACEAVGANALQARVASYFHDIGKGLKPQYFVENQRSGNRHDRLDPFTSARIIISHVSEGGRMAKEHRLPTPIIDNIYMHHGTGLLAYFYLRAREEADDPGDVDESAFRYPGPKPSTREAGIIMLADKVEAATRSIQDPTEEKFRAMIAKIVNSVMADGQFENCPLNFREIYTIAETFVQTLNGIHHHRIEYADTRTISSGPVAAAASAVPPVKAEAVITLDVLPGVPTTPVAAESVEQAAPDVAPVATDTGAQSTASDPTHELGDLDVTDENTDYESIEHLPRG